MPDGSDDSPSTERSASRQAADVCSFQMAISLLDTLLPSPEAGGDADDGEDCEEEDEEEESSCASVS